MLECRYDHDRILRLLVFLKNFIYVENQEVNRIFDEEVQQLTGGIINMGVIEVVKLYASQEGHRKGRLEGKLEGRLEGQQEGKLEGKLEVARKMKIKGFSSGEIAEFTGLSVEEIEKL